MKRSHPSPHDHVVAVILVKFWSSDSSFRSPGVQIATLCLLPPAVVAAAASASASAPDVDATVTPPGPLTDRFPRTPISCCFRCLLLCWSSLTPTAVVIDSRIMEAVLATETEALVFLNQRHSHVQMSRASIIVKLILGLFWGIIHLAISIFNLWSHLIYNLECYLISFGLLWKYWNLNLGRLKYLAIVVDSKEAKNTAKIKDLLSWLSTIGVKYVCIYDIEGVLKKSFDPAMNLSRDGNWGEYSDIGANIEALQFRHKEMVIDCISGSDGKEGIAKAANLLCSTFLNGNTEENGKKEPVFTEGDMANALKAVGCGGPEPDLLLMYGPARCHLGFPAWRLRYTEIMYMGPLKSMKYGALVKALCNFSKKHQNYGK